MSRPPGEPRFEGHDLVLTECARILRRERELVAWPAQVSADFARVVESAAQEARQRATRSIDFLRASASTTPSLAPRVEALIREFELAARPIARGPATDPLTFVLAKSTPSSRVIDAAELLKRIEQRTIDAVNLAHARAQAAGSPDWKSPDEADWQAAVAAAELQVALAALPVDFAPATRHVPLPVARPRPPPPPVSEAAPSSSAGSWQQLLLAGVLSSGISLLVFAGLLRLAEGDAAKAWGDECWSGSEQLAGLGGLLCVLAKGAGLTFGAFAGACASFPCAFAILTLVFVLRTPPSRTDAPRR